MKSFNIQWIPLLLVTISFIACNTKLEGDLILININLIDIETGAVDYSMDVIVDNDTISSIKPHSSTKKYNSTQIIDATDKYLIPGLWDMHAHSLVDYKTFFPMLISNGVTGIREMNGDFDELKLIKKQISEGKILAPVIVTAGAIVDGEPPSRDSYVVASTPEEGRKIVREQKANGADFIKTYFNLEKDVYQAIADECKKQEIPLAGRL